MATCLANCPGVPISQQMALESYAQKKIAWVRPIQRDPDRGYRSGVEAVAAKTLEWLNPPPHTSGLHLSQVDTSVFNTTTNGLFIRS
jgi:hypothetical protein